MKLALQGSSGRVGLEILRLSEGFGFEVVAKGCQDSKLKDLMGAQVLIDFSRPEAFRESLALCEQSGCAFVSGTTGIEKNDFDLLDKASKKIPTLWASNMSVGINFFLSLLSSFSELEGFDFQIEEFHHRHKVDAPSGTALSLQQELQKHRSEKLPEPVSIRGGGIFGVHNLYAMSEEEVIRIEHQALNRAVFAKGALLAAKWLTHQPVGRYEMRDVLKKKK